MNKQLTDQIISAITGAVTPILQAHNIEIAVMSGRLNFPDNSDTGIFITTISGTTEVRMAGGGGSGEPSVNHATGDGPNN